FRVLVHHPFRKRGAVVIPTRRQGDEPVRLPSMIGTSPKTKQPRPIVELLESRELLSSSSPKHPIARAELASAPPAGQAKVSDKQRCQILCQRAVFGCEALTVSSNRFVTTLWHKELTHVSNP